MLHRADSLVGPTVRSPSLFPSSRTSLATPSSPTALSPTVPTASRIPLPTSPTLANPISTTSTCLLISLTPKISRRPSQPVPFPRENPPSETTCSTFRPLLRHLMSDQDQVLLVLISCRVVRARVLSQVLRRRVLRAGSGKDMRDRVHWVRRGRVRRPGGGAWRTRW